MLDLLNAEVGNGKRNKLAARVKKAPMQISEWINGTRMMTDEIAREIEVSAKLESGCLDRQGR
jgi:plasmid maintenance system antidote protein VapI